MIEKGTNIYKFIMVLFVISALLRFYNNYLDNQKNNTKPCLEVFSAQKYTEAIDICTSLSNKGNIGASLVLGKIYADGSGTPKDFVKASSLYHKASQSDNTEVSNTAKTSLADLYKDKDFTQFDLEKSFLWYKSAADNGHGRAQLMLGSMLAIGHGTKQNLELAKFYFQKASMNGQDKANEILSLIEKHKMLN